MSLRFYRKQEEPEADLSPPPDNSKPIEKREEAFELFKQKMGVNQIARQLDLQHQLISYWRKAGDWDAKVEEAVYLDGTGAGVPEEVSAVLWQKLPSRLKELDTMCRTRGPSQAAGIKLWFEMAYKYRPQADGARGGGFPRKVAIGLVNDLDAPAKEEV